MNYQWLIDWVDERIVTRPGTIVLLFVLVTAVFATGLGSIQTETGQQQFIEDLPSFQALEDVQRDFRQAFPQTTTSTTLIQRSQNVLSRRALLAMLRTQKRVAESGPLRVTTTTSAARTVARTLDPDATTLAEQIDVVEDATPGRIDAAVRTAAERDPTFATRLSDDFNAAAASASAAEATITHKAGPGVGGGGGPGSSVEFPANREERIRSIASTTGSDIRVLGSPPDTITATLVLVLPAALLFIVLFLVVAYRDPVDLVLGFVAIIMTIIWTFGFLGLTGIPFAVLLVAVPPLLLAIGIDFGIHAVNRYREERVQGRSVSESMRLTTDQVSVAFFIVTGTSAIGFLSNVTSAFPPTRDFGIAAAAGVVFTFLIFGVFLPAMKVSVDRFRERYPTIPTFADTPLGSQSSPLGRLLSGGVTVAERAPAVFIAVMLLATAAGGVYASGVDTGFSPDDFLPQEETPEYLQALPEPFRPPAEFEYVKLDNFRDRKFTQEGQVLMLVRGRMVRDTALERLHRAGENPPETFQRDGRYAEARSIVTVIRTRAERDPEFRALVRRNDRNGNGIPDDNLPRIYDALRESPASDQVTGFLSEDRRSALVVYTVDGDASDAAITADAREVAAGFRGDAQPTGSAVIFDEALDLVFETVVQSLVLTIVGAALFLVAIYWVLEGSPSLGIANIVPIGMTIVALVASMRALGIKFNAINGTILAIAIGLGIDYSVHVVHRFVDEYKEGGLYRSLERTVVGTGGALTGSMLTTVFGVGVLALALNPAVGVFGLLIALSVFYAYVASIFVLPSVLVLWARATAT